MSSPRVSIVTAVYNPPREAFEDTVRSVREQTFADWEWILTDDCSPAPWVAERLDRLAAEEPRIRVNHRPVNGGIVAASNDSLAGATGEFVALLDHDDVLSRRALATMVEAIDAGDEDGGPVDYAYSDQDLMTADGRRHSPYHKPDWSPERLRHHMYTSHFAVFRRSLVEEVGGFRAGFDGSQDHDLVLRVTERARGIVHVPEILYHWRQVEGSVAFGGGEAKPYAWDAGVRAVQEHVDRLGLSARVSRGRSPGLYHVEREADTTTTVSIIIPTIGSGGVVWGARRTMVTETVRSVIAHSAHTAYELVVVYDAPTPGPVLKELRDIADESGVRLKLIPFREPFNFSAKCNVGALHSDGDVLVFLNDDMEAKTEGFIESLIAPLAEESVGATGPKLLFENLTVQHAGVSYGSGELGHRYYKERPDAIGNHGELWINREVSVLTGACLAIRRPVFDAVGGFSETFPVNYNDVDFCLKIRREGLRLVWLHDVVLYHFESISRSPDVRPWESRRITRRWDNYRHVPERYSNRSVPR
ncbi:MAG: glycosyltransferase [Thermoleophilia bacterium]|nr:glycosyltransferase [Thermoleophilia bacterium]